MMQLAANEAAAVHAVPLPASHWCLFLDVDGTLLELASTPRLKWKFLIYGGLVHKVSSDDDVAALFDKINAEKRPVYEA